MAKKYFDEEKVRALVKTFQESVVLDETEKIIIEKDTVSE